MNLEIKCQLSDLRKILGFKPSIKISFANYNRILYSVSIGGAYRQNCKSVKFIWKTVGLKENYSIYQTAPETELKHPLSIVN